MTVANTFYLINKRILDKAVEMNEIINKFGV
jgi:hypothetical protein